MTTLNKTQKETLQDMKGEEIVYNGEVIGLNFPSIICKGEERKPTLKEWVSIYNAYWDNPENEGYHLKQELKREFGL